MNPPQELATLHKPRQALLELHSIQFLPLATNFAIKTPDQKYDTTLHNHRTLIPSPHTPSSLKPHPQQQLTTISSELLWHHHHQHHHHHHHQPARN